MSARAGSAASDDAEPRGDKGVRSLEGARKRQRDLEDLALISDFEARSGRIGPCVEQPQPGALDSGRENAQAPRGAGGEDLRGDVAIGVDDGALAGLEQALEQLQLGREIGFHRGVIIEMVAREIGEGAGAEADAVEPMLDDAMRGGLERKMRDAATAEFVERLVQCDRIRRRQRAIVRSAGRDDAERAERGGGDARAPPRSAA